MAIIQVAESDSGSQAGEADSRRAQLGARESPRRLHANGGADFRIRLLSRKTQSPKRPGPIQYLPAERCVGPTQRSEFEQEAGARYVLDGAVAVTAEPKDARFRDLQPA